MKCQKCNKEAEMFWTDSDKQNGRSETFYTHKDGSLVCKKCLGHKPKTLQELNKEREKKVLFKFNINLNR